MSFTWSRDAGRDRDRIFDLIAEDKLSAAATNDAKIADIERQLTDFPCSGRVGRLPGTRELVVPGTPVVAVYAVRTGGVLVLRVIHGAQQWPPKD